MTPGIGTTTTFSMLSFHNAIFRGTSTSIQALGLLHRWRRHNEGIAEELAECCSRPLRQKILQRVSLPHHLSSSLYKSRCDERVFSRVLIAARWRTANSLV